MNFKSLANELRVILKARKITYRALASKIGLSESAMKKILTGSDCSYVRINQICDALGLTLSDVLASYNERSPMVFSLNGEQEKYFEANPVAFLFYWRLTHERLSLEAASSHLRFTSSETKRYLFDLDRLNLIMLGKGNRIRIPSIKFVDWKITPGFITKLATCWSQQLVDDSLTPSRDSQFIIKYYQLTTQSFEKLQSALDSIAEQFARRTVREMISTDRKKLLDVRMVSAVARGSFCERIPTANQVKRSKLGLTDERCRTSGL